jgi:hypothetical protein
MSEQPMTKSGRNSLHLDHHEGALATALATDDRLAGLTKKPRGPEIRATTDDC